MNAQQRQTAANPWTKPTDLSHWPACTLAAKKLHPPLPSLLRSPKADTHFTTQQKVEG